MNFGSVERDGVLRELEALLDERGKFSDAASLLAENFLCVGCADDCFVWSEKDSKNTISTGSITDVGNGRRNANFDTRVSLFGQFSLEEFI